MNQRGSLSKVEFLALLDRLDESHVDPRTVGLSELVVVLADRQWMLDHVQEFDASLLDPAELRRLRLTLRRLQQHDISLAPRIAELHEGLMNEGSRARSGRRSANGYGLTVDKMRSELDRIA